MIASFDAILAGALLWIAWRVLASRDLFTAVVLFIVFGLLMALAWVRLGAPDIALAEAAIGAGITGALLLDAVAQIGSVDASVRPAGWIRAVTAVGCAWIAATLALVAWQLPAEAVGLAPVVAASLPASGVTQPVTAVLLNFRAYDTWLELGVLLVAVLALLALRGTADLRDVPPQRRSAMLASLTGLLAPLLVVTGGYLLWLGTHGTGGAFQAGAMLGGAGVLLRMSGYRSIEAAGTRPLRVAVCSGFAAFLLTALGLLAFGRDLLHYPSAHAYQLILLIEASAAVGIGCTLTALFVGATPGPAGASGSLPAPGSARNAPGEGHRA